MAEKKFTHLHLHTEFSLLDGAISLDRLIKTAQEHKQKALGISDHGNIFGAVKFFEKCKKAGIKPILGMEAYITEDAKIKSAENKYYHLLLIVQNEIGYRNLCKLISFSYQQGFYFKPRIDYQILEKHNDGLITSTACLGGHIPKLLLNNQEEEAEKRLDWFMTIFGKERFYLEVQPAHQKEQKELNQKLFQISNRKQIDLIATADSHYVSLEDRHAHEVMLCINTHAKITDPDRYSFGECVVPMWSTQEMLDFFPKHHEAIYNTGKIADLCTFDFPTGKLFFPHFEIPKEHTQETFFKHQCLTGFDRLLERDVIPPEQKEHYLKRLEIEINLITSMGFIGYFLVVGDFIQWAKRQNIPVGPGRGSAAGSLVAWALEITNIDPIKYNLLFERFLNPERISMPDIDIDFCVNGRENVINYVRQKYGHENVGQIITFGTMMAKGVIKDVSRALGLPFEDSNALTTLIGDQLKITLKEAIEKEPRLQEFINSNPKIANIFDLAYRLEGLTRHASKHAAGIVISPEPIDEVLPVYVPPKSTELVTQYAMTELEALGFLKIDFLGLNNLTIIDQALRSINKNHGITINLDKIPLDDHKTFALIRDGNTSGVFQLESEGLKNVLRRLQPDKFEDIIAVNALYRPGPLGSGMVDDYIERRHGRAQITYLFPELEEVVKETYGVIVYQEQVMKIASVIAGYTLGQADILRRAMGKKKAEVMAEQKSLFVAGAQKKNLDIKKAGDLFDLMAYFAGYGFNKSHSAAYAMIAYQTAYLKANFPAEYMASLITLAANDTEKLAFYLQESKNMGIPILPPDINKSEIVFSVINGSLLFGLLGIKNVGIAALENIMKEREKNGPFHDLLDFCLRLDLRMVNKRVIESLICSGAFDKLIGHRSQQYEELSLIMDRAIIEKRSRETGQLDLFSLEKKETNTPEPYTYKPLPEWPDKEKLEKEKDIIGFYLSAHPLESYKQIKYLNLKTFDILKETTNPNKNMDEPIVVGCGIIKQVRTITTKKGDLMAFVQLEDTKSESEIILFPRTYKKVQEWLTKYEVFIVKGALDTSSTHKCKIKANEFIPLELMWDQWPSIEQIYITLPSSINEEKLAELKKVSKRGNTPTTLLFHDQGKRIALQTKSRLKIDASYIEFLEQNNINLKIQL